MELRAKDLRYTVQHSDCRKSGAKVAKKSKSPTKNIRNLIIHTIISKIYQYLYQFVYKISPK